MAGPLLLIPHRQIADFDCGNVAQIHGEPRRSRFAVLHVVVTICNAVIPRLDPNSSRLVLLFALQVTQSTEWSRIDP